MGNKYKYGYLVSTLYCIYSSSDGQERQNSNATSACANNNAPTPSLVLDIDANDRIVEVTPSTLKDLFLQRYDLKTLGITTIARWMYAVGFRLFKKR
jgi:hypothetical protein